MITLRALEPEDLELLYTIENSPEMWLVGSTATPYSRHALRQHIRLMGADITDCGELRFVIEAPSTINPKPSTISPKPIGLIDLTNYDARAQRAEVSIAMLKEHQGQGFGSEALRLLEQHCREFLHLHQIYALVPEGNSASAQLFQKCGFQHTSTLIDWHFGGGKYQNTHIFQKILQKV